MAANKKISSLSETFFGNGFVIAKALNLHISKMHITFLLNPSNLVMTGWLKMLLGMLKRLTSAGRSEAHEPKARHDLPLVVPC